VDGLCDMRIDSETAIVVLHHAEEAMICTGRESGYGGSGPTRGIAVCRAALFLAANRARKWGRQPPDW